MVLVIVNLPKLNQVDFLTVNFGYEIFFEITR